MKDGLYVTNVDECKSKGTRCIAIYVKNNAATCFDSFAVEHVPKKIKKFIDNKIVRVNIYRIQAYDSKLDG